MGGSVVQLVLFMIQLEWPGLFPSLPQNRLFAKIVKLNSKHSMFCTGRTRWCCSSSMWLECLLESIEAPFCCKVMAFCLFTKLQI